MMNAPQGQEQVVKKHKFTEEQIAFVPGKPGYSSSCKWRIARGDTVQELLPLQQRLSLLLDVLVLVVVTVLNTTKSVRLDFRPRQQGGADERSRPRQSSALGGWRAHCLQHTAQSRLKRNSLRPCPAREGHLCTACTAR